MIENIDKSNMPETLLPTVVKYNVYQTFYFIFFYNAIELGKIKSPYMKHFYLSELYENFITCINTSMHNNIDIKDLPNLFHTIDKKLYNVYQDAIEANELFTSLYETLSEKLQCNIPNLQQKIDKRKTFFEDEVELNFTLTNYINPLYSKTKHILHKKSSSNMILDLVNIHHSNYNIPTNYRNCYNNLFLYIRIFDMVHQEDNQLPINSHFSSFRKLLEN